MKTIVVSKTRTYVRPATEKSAERSMVCINDTVHVSLKQLGSLGYTNAQALIGNKVNVDFYAKDEEMFNGAKCTKDDTIVKSFEVEASTQDIALAKAVNAGMRGVILS